MKKGHTSHKRPSEEGLTLISLSCPDCGGVLSEKRAGPKKMPFYMCQIKHRYTAVSLFEGKEYRLEATLCAGLTQSKQLAVLYKEMLKTGSLPPGITRTSIQRRIRELKRHETEMGTLLTDAHLLGSVT